MIQYENITHYVRTVSGVDEDLVVGVSFPLDLLGAVGYRGLRFAKGGENTDLFQNHNIKPHNGR